MPVNVSSVPIVLIHAKQRIDRLVDCDALFSDCVVGSWSTFTSQTTAEATTTINTTGPAHDCYCPRVRDVRPYATLRLVYVSHFCTAVFVSVLSSGVIKNDD